MKVQEFFSIVPWNIIFAFCNLLILCSLMKKFLFKPVMAVLEKRQQEIDGLYDAANTDRAQAAQMKQDYDQRLSGARAESDSLVKKAVETASLRSDAILKEAQEQAGSMMQLAENEIEQQKVKAIAQVKKEMSGMAVDIAEQMVSREIKADDYDKLVDEFIRNAGEEA